MANDVFYLRYSNRTFEHFSGHGYVDAGGSPERVIPLSRLWSLHLGVKGDILDEKGQVIEEEYLAEGTRVVALMDAALYQRVLGML